MVRRTDLDPRPHDWWSQLLGPMRHIGARVAEFFSPSAEAAETAESYEIALELPGMSDDEIHLEIHGDRLVVTGEKRARREERGKDYYFSERAYGRFSRSFQLPADADLDAIGAAHKDGVLTVTIPRRASPRPEGRKIPVARG